MYVPNCLGLYIHAKVSGLNSIYGQLNQEVRNSKKSYLYTILLIAGPSLKLVSMTFESDSMASDFGVCHQFRLIESTQSLLNNFYARDFCSSFSIVVVLTQNWKLNPVTVNIKRLSYLSPSNGNSIVWRADSWRRTVI